MKLTKHARWLVIVFGLLFLGCSRSQPDGFDSYQGLPTDLPVEMSFTWFRPPGNKESIYIVNGQAIGSGRQGFVAFIQRAAELPEGSRVRVLTPDFNHGLIELRGGSGFGPHIDIYDDAPEVRNELLRVSEARKLKIEESYSPAALAEAQQRTEELP